MPPVHRKPSLFVATSVFAFSLLLPIAASALAQEPTTPAKPLHITAHPQPNASSSASAETPSEDNTDQPNAADAVPPAPSGFLTQRISVSDTHHVWHPSRRQLGITKSDGGYSIDTAKLTSYLQSIAPYVRRMASKERVALAGAHVSNPLSSSSSSMAAPAKVLPASPGIKLDVAASAVKLASALKSNPKATHLVLSVQTTAAPAASDDLDGINARIAHFVTRFNPGERGRTQTVRLAIKLINGHIVAPGEVFSVNQAVGERTAQRGFGKGIVFYNGKQETQLGGGMCQVATTLFNAALLADLKIVQRYQHVRTVPYVKPGDDATVYWGQKDFKFENDTQTPLYISYITTASHAICDIYGKAEPDMKVSVNDTYKHLGPRHYTAILRRYVTKNGVKRIDYTAYSAYKWTPSLDYNI